MKNICKKSFVISIILLLIGVSVSSAISVDNESTISNRQSEECIACKEVSDTDLILVERLLDRVEVYSKWLMVLSRHNPELKQVCEELINEIKIVNNVAKGTFTYCLLLFIKIYIVGKIAIYLDMISCELPEDSTLYKIFYNLTIYFWNKFSELIDSGKDYDCWWWEPDPHP
jgi:hypothetical protein